VSSQVPAILELLTRPIAFHRIFARITGSVTAGLMLSQAWYWTRHTEDPEGWFYKSIAEWEDETGLTRREQETARRRLRETGLWKEQLAGRPPIVHFRLDLDKLAAAVRNVVRAPAEHGGKRQIKHGGKRQIDMAESAKLNMAENAIRYGGKRQIINKETETTTETTWAESTQRECADAPCARENSPPKKSSTTPKADRSPANKQLGVKGVKGKKGKAPANRPAKSPFHSHPAVVAYRDTLGYKQINSAQAELIAQATGAELVTAPDRWIQFLKDLSVAGKSGSKAANVGVVVEAFGYYQSGDLLAVALDKAWRHFKGETQGANSNDKSSTRKTAGENLRESIEWTLS
jgi:hypothetical protein